MKKRINVIALCSILLIVACAQKNEVAVLEPVSSEESKTEMNEIKDSVLFTAFVFGNQQVLTAEGEVYFLNHEGEKVDQPFIGVCGTVPHYELTIESLASEFVLYSDETFYDSGNEITPEVMIRISKEKADSVKWLNKQTRFIYTSNSTIGVFNGVAPDTYFIYKDGKVKISSDQSGTWYDNAVADRFQIVVEKDGKKGVFGISDLLFSDIQPFNYYLARYTDLEGNQGYLITDGQVFPD